MAHFMDRLSERVSRRGMFVTIRKIVAALGTITTIGLVTEKVAAAADPLACCSGTYCGQSRCQGDSYVGYKWTCFFASTNKNVICIDCFAAYKRYVCTYSA